MKGLRMLALFCLLSLALAATALAEDAVIHEYRAQCVVDSHGQAKMTVSVDMDIPTGVVTMDFPIGDGTDGMISGSTSKRVKTEDGYVLRLREETGISGRRTFVFTYSMGQVIKDSAEGQQLSLEMIAPGWQWPMETASFTVNLPAPFTGDPSYLGGYRGELVDDFWTFQTTEDSISGLAGEELLDHDDLHITLSLPAEYVTIRNTTAGLVVLILIAVLAGACAVYWYLKLFSPLPAIYLHTVPPKGVGAGSLPLIHSAASPSLAVQLTEWAALGYIHILMGKRGRVYLRRTMPMDGSRHKVEIWAYQNLFAEGDVCDCSDRRFAAVRERYDKLEGSWWRRQLFSRTGGSPLLLYLLAALTLMTASIGAVLSSTIFGSWRVVLLILSIPVGFAAGLVIQQGPLAYIRRHWPWAAAAAAAALAMLIFGGVLGSFWTIALAVAVQIFAALGTLRGGRRSKYGRAVLAETLGFHRYLAHVDRKELNIRLREDGQFFYHLLPFAEAIGQGQTFAKGFGEIKLGPCPWLEGLKKPPRTSESFYELYTYLLRRMSGK